MTVTELIAALRDLPPDAEVFTHGYEMGLVPMNRVRMAAVAPADMAPDSGSWWCGSHDEENDGVQSVVLEHSGRHSNSGER